MRQFIETSEGVLINVSHIRSLHPAKCGASSGYDVRDAKGGSMGFIFGEELATELLGGYEEEASQ